MRIVIICGSFLPEINGGTTNVDERLRILSSLGHTVLVLCPSYSLLSKKYPSYAGHLGEVLPGVTVVGYPSRHAFIEVTLFPRLLSFGWAAQRIREFRPEVISVESPERLYWGSLQCVGCIGRALAVPTIAVHHANYVAIIEGAGKAVPLLRAPSPLLVGLMKMVTRHVYNTYDAIVVHAEAAVDYLALYGVEKSRIVPCPFLGVNTRTFNPDVPKVQGVRSPHEHVLFLYVGRISEEKQISVLLEGFRKIREPLGPKVELLVVGGGDDSYVDQLKAAACDGVRFYGPVDNAKLGSFYTLCDVFVTPSPNESAGLTVLEACAAGKPVVGADGGGVGELVNDKVGRKFTPGNSAECARVLRELAEDAALRARLGKEAVRYAQDNSIDKGTRRIVDLWEDAVKTGVQPVPAFENLPLLVVMLVMCASTFFFLFPQGTLGLAGLALHAALLTAVFKVYEANRDIPTPSPLTNTALAILLGSVQLTLEFFWVATRVLRIRPKKIWE